MNIGEALFRNARHSPQQLAIVDRRRSLTFLAFHGRVNRLAQYLLQRGVGKGDLVALSCGSRAEHFEALFAVGNIGAVAVPFDFNWSAQECEAMTGFFAPKAFILEGRTETKALAALARERVDAKNLLLIEDSATVAGTPYEEALHRNYAHDLEVAIQGTDPFLLMITSGTTGFPKACSINHQTYAMRCLNYGMTKGMNKDERALMTLPVHFNAGRGSVMSILYLGGTIFIQEKFDEQTVLETIEREGITYTMLVPVLCERLLRYEGLGRFNTSSLRYLGITGGHLSRQLAHNIRKHICPELYEAYASTDCGQITSIGPGDWATRGDTVGKPIWCVLLRITGNDGREVPRGEEGEICVRTPLTIQGYYQNPAATEEFLSGGWCHTGDIGFVDAEGYLTVSGRKKNMIKSGGISVFPEEIEETLRKHPAVTDVAVVGFKSAEWGEAVKAFVVRKEGARCDAESLIKFCKESLASYKAPKVVEFLSSLPRTGLGKIDRGKLESIG
ncbi:MAG: class I adenylate-forming enzyme family protein [Alphaproteobacteria bacterium]